MKKNRKEQSLTSDDRILDITAEAENELVKVQKEIERLEKYVEKLNQLRQQEFKLKSIILSFKNITKNSDVDVIFANSSLTQHKNKNSNVNVSEQNFEAQFARNRREVFLPDEAVSQVRNILRTKNNLNYEIFKAIVFNSGYASTEELKNYLVENNIRQPQTGKSFADVELKEISSRANYLVRKNILVSPTPGLFKSVFGWQDVD